MNPFQRARDDAHTTRAKLESALAHTAITAKDLLLQVESVLNIAIEQVPPSYADLGGGTAVLHREQMFIYLNSKVDAWYGLIDHSISRDRSFAAYTYVTPFLIKVTEVPAASITPLLLAYGLSGIGGNFIAAGFVTHRLRVALMIMATCIAVPTLLLFAAGPLTWLALPLVIVWGAAFGALPMCLQTWMFRHLRGSPEAGQALFVSLFQITVAAGAFLGSQAVGFFELRGTMAVGGTVAAVGVSTIWWSLFRRAERGLA